jgi:hypothetical protein
MSREYAQSCTDFHRHKKGKKRPRQGLAWGREELSSKLKKSGFVLICAELCIYILLSHDEYPRWHHRQNLQTIP